ncbi:MAG: heterodisulfide reductase-related iron-sulfur binding cluster [Alistipes indistinctus]
MFTYHDPCELGRGSGIYEAPREVIGVIGELREVAENREHALCCGSSLGNIAISDDGQRRIGQSVADMFAATGAGSVVTACPLCKNSHCPQRDIARIRPRGDRCPSAARPAGILNPQHSIHTSSRLLDGAFICFCCSMNSRKIFFILPVFQEQEQIVSCLKKH